MFLGYGTRYTPLAVLKIKDSGTAPGHRFFPEAREFSRTISAKCVTVQTASFSMELSDWLALSHMTLCGRGYS